MTTPADHRARLAVLVSFSGQGGVERMMLNLLQGFIARGQAVDLLTIRAESAHLRRVPSAVRVLDLGVRHSTLALPPLLRYLRRDRPRALLAAKDRAIRVAALARRLAGNDVRLVGRLGTHLSAALQDKHSWRRWWRYQPMRWAYPSVDQIVAVSQGVADDILAITGLPRSRVTVVRNPVVTPDLPILAQAAPGHTWFNDGGAPIILGAGRLTRQKDFPTLIRAVSEVRRRRPVRLVILGEGRQRQSLQALAARLGVADAVDLPGFADNPYAYMARAAVFALSSVWEGSPNVLAEALAVGTPVVATDCPSGPREILHQGRYGALIPVGDVSSLAQAIVTTLDNPLGRARLQAAVEEYTLETSTQGYLRALGVED